MNLSKMFNFHKEKELSYKELMDQSGIIRYKRNIDIYANFKNNEHNIENHNMVKTVSCIVTNYSVSKTDNDDEVKLIKAVYIATLEIKNFSMDNINNTMIPFLLNRATFKPEYGFITYHISSLKDVEKYTDFGLTLIDYTITSEDGQYALINFSNNKINYREIFKNSNSTIYPKYYTTSHCKLDNNKYIQNVNYNYDLNELIDDKTEITIVPFKSNHSYIKHGGKRVAFNNRTKYATEFFNEVFSHLLLLSMEKLEFRYDIDTKCVTLCSLQYFDSFYNGSKITEDIRDLLAELNKICNNFNKKREIKCLFYYYDRNRDKIRIIYKNGDIFNYEISRYNSLFRFVIDRDEYMEDIIVHKSIAVEDILTKSLEFMKSSTIQDTLRIIDDVGNMKEISRIEQDTLKLE